VDDQGQAAGASSESALYFDVLVQLPTPNLQLPNALGSWKLELGRWEH
jgi:hypothetical protein